MLTQELVHISIVVVSAWIVALSSGQACRAKFTFQQVCTTSYGVVLRQLSTPSAGPCGIACNKDTVCLSFMYDPGTQVCRTSNGIVTSFPSSCSNDELVYYAEIVRASCYASLIGDHCSINSECGTPNSQCYNNMCRCLPGYSHRMARDSCHGECPAPGYGSTWTREYYYIDQQVTSYQETLSYVASLAACQTLCVQSTLYTCRYLTYMLAIETCLLHNETAYTQPGSVLNEDFPDYRHSFIRNCL